MWTVRASRAARPTRGGRVGPGRNPHVALEALVFRRQRVRLRPSGISPSTFAVDDRPECRPAQAKLPVDTHAFAAPGRGIRRRSPLMNPEHVAGVAVPGIRSDPHANSVISRAFSPSRMTALPPRNFRAARFLFSGERAYLTTKPMPIIPSSWHRLRRNGTKQQQCGFPSTSAAVRKRGRDQSANAFRRFCAKRRPSSNAPTRPGARSVAR